MASWVQQIDPFLPADSHFVFSFRTIFPARPIIEPGHVLALWNQSTEVQPPASHGRAMMRSGTRRGVGWARVHAWRELAQKFHHMYRVSHVAGT